MYFFVSRLLNQKYKNLKLMLTGLTEFVVVDGNMCINFTRRTDPDSCWLLQNSNQHEKGTKEAH
jgi:hypothetical protein